MAYERVNWENLPSKKTPVNADNLNKMDKGIKDLETELSKKASTTADGLMSKEDKSKLDLIKIGSFKLIYSTALGTALTFSSTDSVYKDSDCCFMIVASKWGTDTGAGGIWFATSGFRNLTNVLMASGTGTTLTITRNDTTITGTFNDASFQYTGLRIYSF